MRFMLAPFPARLRRHFGATGGSCPIRYVARISSLTVLRSALNQRLAAVRHGASAPPAPLGVRPVEQELGPLGITERSPGQPAARYALRRRIEIRFPVAPRSTGSRSAASGELQFINAAGHQVGHPSIQLPQCATAAAAASSISRPVWKRSSENGAAIGCISSLRHRMRANTCADPGVALKPPVPQPQLT